MSDEMTLEQALILLDESRQHNAAMLDRLYEALNIDSGDGEIRFKWAMLEVNQVISERDTLKQQNAELAARVEALKAVINKNVLMEYRGSVMGPDWAKDAVAN